MTEPTREANGMNDCRDASSDAERLERAILGFHRHANLVEQRRALLERFRAAQVTFTEERALFEGRRAANEDARRQWQAHRQSCASHRESVRQRVRSYVQRIRDDGVPPERVLMAVKERLGRCITEATPAAPYFDARALESDISGWTIAAFYDAA